MDEDVWEFIWMKFHSSQAVSEKKILLEALTCSDNVFLLNRSQRVPVPVPVCAGQAGQELQEAAAEASNPFFRAPVIWTLRLLARRRRRRPILLPEADWPLQT